jgi:hypothetical protein
MEDVAALVEVSRDPVLRQWTSSVVDNDADGARWVQAQQQGWAAGDRFGFAVLEIQPGSVREQVDHVAAFVAAPARSRATRSGALSARKRAWKASTSLKTIASPAARLPAPFVTLVPSRTVANVDPTGFVVRRWKHCSAGKS